LLLKRFVSTTSTYIPSTERASMSINEIIDAASILEEKFSDSKTAPLISSPRVANPLNKPHVSQMETGEESSSRPINRFRAILYEEGELENTDFSKPPSRTNLYPFEPSSLPPTHSRSIVPYVNHLPLLQRLVDLGMNLFEVEKNTKIGRHLLRLDLVKDVKPKIHWLVETVGISPDELGSYLTRNPYFLIQNLENMKMCVQYLSWKKFKRSDICKIIVGYRFWLNMDVRLMDSRLGWLQRQFRLNGDEMRALIVKEPRVLMFGLGPIQRITISLNRECGFSWKELKVLLKSDPRLFLVNPDTILRTYNYLAYVMRIPNQQMLKTPIILRCPVPSLQQRHKVLKSLKKDNYECGTPNYVSLEELISPSDRYFAENVAGISIEDYNRFLKLL